MGSERKKNLDEAQLKAGEEPELYKIEKKFIIIPSYLNNTIITLPSILKEQNKESEESHRLRVSKYLLSCDTTTF